MAYAWFGSYAPCGFLIVPDNGDPYDEEHTTLIQSDWDYPGIAQAMGWNISAVQHDPEDHDFCPHNSTDGTVICRECGMTVSQFIGAAYDYIYAHQDEEFSELDSYLPENE